MKMIQKIKSYSDFKKLSKNDLPILVTEIRSKIIEISKSNEIHLSSNLGIVELSLAVDYFFDLDNDYVIYDTGHQSYTHKMITGRYAYIDTIRKENGLCGLLDMNESIYDHYSPGHSGNTLAIGAGYKLANQTKNIVNIIGDSSLVSGIALEALNFISFNNLNNIIIINDNNMSISSPIGAISQMLLSKKKSKTFFNNLNYKYIGFIDGHNFNALFKALTKAKAYSKTHSVIVHVKTIKGYGYPLAQNDHVGLAHSNILRITKKQFGTVAYDFLKQKMKTDSSLFIINPAMAIGSGFKEMLLEKNNHYIDTGITEDFALSLGSGLALKKQKVYCLYYSTFLQRAYDQLIHDVVRLKVPLVLLIDRADLSGADGSSHHGIFDVAYLKTLPNTTITSPRTFKQMELLLALSYLDNNKLFVIRYPKSYFDEPKITDDLNILEYGQWEHLKLFNKQTKIVLISYGPYLNNIINYFLTNKIEVDIVNAIFINDFNLDEIKIILEKYDHIICYERIYGDIGLYNEILNHNNILNTNKKVYPMYYSDIPKNGSTSSLDKQFNMDLLAIENLILSIKN